MVGITFTYAMSVVGTSNSLYLSLFLLTLHHCQRFPQAKNHMYTLVICHVIPKRGGGIDFKVQCGHLLFPLDRDSFWSSVDTALDSYLPDVLFSVWWVVIYIYYIIYFSSEQRINAVTNLSGTAAKLPSCPEAYQLYKSTRLS